METPMNSPLAFNDLSRLELALVIREARRRTGNTRLFPTEVLRDIVRHLDMEAPVVSGEFTPVYISGPGLCDSMPTPKRLDFVTN